MRKLGILAALLAVSGALIHVGDAKALAPCGTVTASTTLARDCAAPLTIAADRITVDLHNHAVVCAGGQGIEVVGNGDRVRNGRVTGCDYGVVVNGSGNRLSLLRVTGSGFVGFYVPGGTANRFMTSAAHGYVYGAWVVGGGWNEFTALYLDGPSLIGPTVGVYFLDTVSNWLRESTITGFRRAVEVASISDESPGNVIRRNLIRDYVSGIALDFSDSTAVNLNELHGGSAAALGIWVYFSSGNSVSRNTVVGNSLVGIWLADGATGNSVHLNSSLWNGLDLEDSSPACHSNSWRSNVFETSNQPCIR